MNRNAQLIYLKDVVEMEFFKNRLEKELINTEEKIGLLGIPKQFAEPEKPQISGLVANIVEFIVFTLLGVGVFCLGYKLENLFGTILKVLSGLWMLFLVWCYSPLNKQDKRDMEEYQKKLAEYKQLLQSDTSRVRDENIQKKQLIGRYEAMQAQYKDLQKLLQKAYGINLIPNPYRNLGAIYYIYDFMKSSQCSLSETLLHQHFEDGINRVLQKLDVIIEQNETIILQNACIEAASKNIQRQNERLLGEIQSVSASTEEIAYSAKVAAINTEFCAWINLIDFVERH